MRYLTVLALLAACGGSEPTSPPAPTLSPASTPAAFNAAAQREGAHLAWVEDDGDGIPQEAELVALWGPGAPPEGAPLARWFEGGRPTPALVELWGRLSHPAPLPEDTAEAARRAAVRAKLDETRPALVYTDLREAPAWERDFVRAMEDVAREVERLHLHQLVAEPFRAPADDPESRALFERLQGPWCDTAGPCSARATAGPRRVGIYPVDLQEAPDFCATLEAVPGLMDNPFAGVGRDEAGELVPVPYSQSLGDSASRLPALLERAAAALPDEEAPLRAYLGAVKRAFADNDWFAADVAWAAMNAKNSRFYVRIGPDEVYWDPCNRKAGFAVVLAHIDPEGLAWQQRLEPHRDVFEALVAKHAGPVYQARRVAFSMPEFIQIMLNAGNSRAAVGATIGQSLPNWGPVADAGGRTVAMTNLGVDAVSRATRKEQAASLLCSVEHYSEDPEHLLLSTLLHEAAHNLGPAQNYRIEGRTDEQVFGGELAAMLEELKAQSAALTLTDHLVLEHVVDEDFAHATHTADIVWSLGKIATGTRDAAGTLKPYPALSAIQLGFLEDQGVLRWDEESLAANGADKGCLAVDYDKLGGALEALATRTIGAKARGDVDDVKAMVAEYVDGPRSERFALYAERWGRAPETTYVYGLRYE